MESKSTIPLYHKIIVCLLATLVTGACFNRFGTHFLGQWIPEYLTFVITIAMLLCAPVFMLIWNRKEKGNKETAPLLGFCQGVIRFVVALDLSMFGWVKIFHLQFWVPLEMLDEPFSHISSNWLTWMYFGHSYPMDVSIGISQIAGSYLLLFSRTRLIGVFVTLPILLNILLIDIFYDMGSVGVHAGIMFAAVLYLLLSEYDALVAFFLQRKQDATPLKLTNALKKGLRCSVVVIPLFLVVINPNDPHPQLRGKYDVAKIMINGVDKTKDMRCDSVLSVVYLEIGSTCIFQFRDYTQRVYGLYHYDEVDHQFNVYWLDAHYEHLEATLSPSQQGKINLIGKLGTNTLEAELAKVK